MLDEWILNDKSTKKNKSKTCFTVEHSPGPEDVTTYFRIFIATSANLRVSTRLLGSNQPSVHPKTSSGWGRLLKPMPMRTKILSRVESLLRWCYHMRPLGGRFHVMPSRQSLREYSVRCINLANKVFAMQSLHDAKCSRFTIHQKFKKE